MGEKRTEIGSYFLFWEQLTREQRQLLLSSVRRLHFQKGEMIHRGEEDCLGILYVLSGQIRVYSMSEEGRELTLYRLVDGEVCLLSASCMFSGIQFDVMISAERETEVLLLPARVYRKLMNESAPVANFTNELLAEHFSEVMWLMDQILNKKLDTRLAALLLEESELSGSEVLYITHERLANHLGSIREVVSRMLKYFQNEKLVHLGRGTIRLLDKPRLEELAAESLR